MPNGEKLKTWVYNVQLKKIVVYEADPYTVGRPPADFFSSKSPDKPVDLW